MLSSLNRKSPSGDDELLQYWGKARAGQGVPSWHPLPFHLLDVAAVVKALLVARPTTRQRGEYLLGLSAAALETFLCAVASLHDLGKFAPKFQALASPAGWHMPTGLSGIDVSRFETARHTVDGLVLWRTHLRQHLLPMLLSGTAELRELEYAIFTHHGRPQHAPKGAVELATRFPDASIRCALHCAQRTVVVVGHSPATPHSEGYARWKLASWWVAGLLVLADWVGSRQEWFPYTSPLEHPTLESYWQVAQRRAQQAIILAGLVSAVPRGAMSFAALTGRDTPTPVQQWAEAHAGDGRQRLVVIEDATGAGKTEAASMIVHRWLAAGACSGAFWAMPTQATANAMYLRQNGLIANLFTSVQHRPSLVLSHGSAHLHDSFRHAVIGDQFRPSDDDEASDTEMSSNSACPAFLADDRRAGLLADVGAGTVDQVLLAILPTKFNALRLFALAEKALVLDEVHAYDVYMGVEIEALLRLHAMLGGAAVLLSATLPQQRRLRIERVWAESTGGGLHQVEPGSESRYPLVTVVGPNGDSQRTSPAAAPRSIRSVAVRVVHSENACVEAVLQAYRLGASVCWIRNTVKACVSAAALVRAAGVEATVFHSRFAQGDRQCIEAELVRSFGPENAHRPARVVVATQVVEQSLDLDFDLIVTDLAPIDLLLQRSGRLWRHERRRRPVASPEVVVLGPDPADPVRENWLEPEASGTRRVYQRVGVLWRTWQRLLREPYLSVPGALRTMIEEVYDPEGDVPDVLVSADVQSDGEDLALQAIARQLVIGRASGYAPEYGFEDDRRASTRAGEKHLTVRLAAFEDGVLRPWVVIAGASDLRLWALSEVRIPAFRFRGGLRSDSEYSSQVERLVAGWPEFERDLPVLVLAERGGRFGGRLVNRLDDRPVLFEYSRAIGLAEAPA